MFAYETKVRFHHVDAAGVVFFANYFQMAHEAYESFLEYLTFDPKYLFEEGIFIPIVHAESDYQKPVRLGDKVMIEMTIERIGNTSFTLNYHFINQHCDTVAKIKTVHTVIDPKEQKAIPLPKKFRTSLENLSHGEKSGQVF